jgi:hypothetical protein
MNCPVRHPKQTSGRDEARWKAEQEKQRRDQAIANTTGLRVLSAIAAAVPVRLLKRDLMFVLEKLVSILDESRIETLARQHGIRQKWDEGGIAKTLRAFMRRADEGTLSRLMVEATILLAASRHGSHVLKDAATLYKVNTEAIGQKVKQEFAAKAKAKREPKLEAKPRCQGQESGLAFHPSRGGKPAASRFFDVKNRAGRHRFGFSLHPRSRFCSGLRSPAARQKSLLSSVLTFPKPGQLARPMGFGNEQQSVLIQSEVQSIEPCFRPQDPQCLRHGDAMPSPFFSRMASDNVDTSN